MSPESRYLKRRYPEQPAERPDTTCTPNQMGFLARHGLAEGPTSYDTADRLISRFVAERRRMSPTPRQEALLRREGIWREGMTRGEAFDAIGRLIRAEQARA